MGHALGIVYCTFSDHLIRKAGYAKVTAQNGAVTFIQLFGYALNLNVHHYMLFLDGVNAEDTYTQQRLHRLKAPIH